MTTYRVVWQIDIEAESPKDAARAAQEIQRDPNSIATVFEVNPDGEDWNIVTVDLNPEA